MVRFEGIWRVCAATVVTATATVVTAAAADDDTTATRPESGGHEETEGQKGRRLEVRGPVIRRSSDNDGRWWWK